MKTLSKNKGVAVVIYEDATLEQVAPVVTVGFLNQVMQNLHLAIESVTISLEQDGQERGDAG